MTRRQINAQALTIGLSTMPFGVAFAVVSAEAGLRWWEASGFSVLVFGGSAQFAAVGVLGAGGSVTAAIVAGALLNLRQIAFGILLAPDLKGPRWWRALVSQWMIDESTAIAVGQTDTSLRRHGYLAGGLSVFVLWNVATLIGVVAAGSLGDNIERFGLDATIPAAFLALLWPRLEQPAHRRNALIGTLIAAVLVPVAPAGLPIIASVLAVLTAQRPRA